MSAKSLSHPDCCGFHVDSWLESLGLAFGFVAMIETL